MTVQLNRRQFTVEEYHRMAETGILRADERVELLEGEIVEMNPIGSPHASSVKRLVHLRTAHIRDRAIIGVQDPIQLGEHSEPQPDLSVLRPRADFYRSAHPGPADVLFLIEVAWSSLPVDRRVKLPLYARHGIPEVWLVDVDGRRLEVHRGPGDDGYRRVEILARGERERLLEFPDVELSVDEVLG